MHFDLLLNNILSIPILFFFLGFIAVQIKSDLEVPQQTSRFLSIYLLMSIGLKGGHELAHGEWNTEVIKSLLIALTMSAAIPLYVYPLIRKRFNSYNAAAIAATYGSISVVTFISAVAFLNELQVSFGGYMVAAMTLMESPALIISLIMLRKAVPDAQNKKDNLFHLFTESLTNSSVLIIIGGLIIGFITPEQSFQDVKPFTEGIFKGFLSVFLLDMGIVASKRIKALTRAGSFLIIMSLLFPLINALSCIALSYILHISAGNALLLAVLCSSASYIAVPAAVRITIPQANPGLFVPMALTVTFPFNVTVGIPLYYYFITQLWN